MELRYIYKKCLREAQQIQNINVKEFIIRRCKLHFRNKTLKTSHDPLNALETIKRYKQISNIYYSPLDISIINKI